MIRHIVLLKWEEGLTIDEQSATIKGLKEVITTIEGVENFTVFRSCQLSDISSDVVLFMDFIDAEAWQKYQDNTSHKTFVATHLSPKLSSRSMIQINVAKDD